MMKRAKATIIWAAAMAIIASALALIPAGGTWAEESTGWIMCGPTGRVNIRERPSRKAEVVAWGYMGDEITLDGKKKGMWVHCILPCEAGEGWIRGDYLTTDEPEYPENGRFEVDHNKVRIRESAGGKVKGWAMDGDEVTVYQVTPEWCVTNRGFIKTRYLIQLPEVTEDAR